MSESPPLWIEPEREGEARLALDLVPPSKRGARLWFFLPGFTSHRRREKTVYFARQVARRGEAFASLDFTGHGESGGELKSLTLTRNLRDLERGLAFVERAAGPFSSTVLIGSSMGGLTALWYAAANADRVAALVLIAPAFEMAGRMLLSLGAAKARRWREQGIIHMETEYAEFDLEYCFVEDESRYPTGQLIKKLATPTLIFHGTHDDLVPHHLSVSFTRRKPDVRLILIEGGDHRLTAHKEGLFGEMWSFVQQTQAK